MKKQLIFAIQSRLQRDADGIIRTPVGYARYQAWAGYLRTFDELILVSRVESVPDAKGPEVEGPGVRVVEAPYYRGLTQLVRALPRMQKFVKDNFTKKGAFYGGRLPDVMGILLLRQSKFLGARYLAQVVGDPAEILRSGVAGRIGAVIAPIVAMVLRRTVSKADAVIYVTRETLQRLYPPAGSAVVLSRSNVELSQDAIARFPRDYVKDGLNEPLRIVTAGSQEQNYKGHDLLIRAVRIWHASGLRPRVTIIGGGKRHESLKELATELQVTDDIHFVDRLPSADHVRQFIAKSDLFVLPSRTEGLPRVLLEAMATGIICLGANVGGVPELLNEEWIFPPNDPAALANAVASVVEDPEKLSAGAYQQWDMAREVANHYSGDDILTEFLDGWTRQQDHP